MTSRPEPIELERRAPEQGESASTLPLNNTHALLTLISKSLATEHSRRQEAVAKMSSRAAPDIGVN